MGRHLDLHQCYSEVFHGDIALAFFFFFFFFREQIAVIFFLCI